MSRNKKSKVKSQSNKKSSGSNEVKFIKLDKPQFKNSATGKTIIEGFVKGSKIAIKDFEIVSKRKTYKVN